MAVSYTHLGYTEIVSILDEILDRTESLQEVSPEEAVTQEKSFINCCPSIDLLPDSLADKRVVTTGGYTAYLKIAKGCNKRCTYCIIPYIRGQYRLSLIHISSGSSCLAFQSLFMKRDWKARQELPEEMCIRDRRYCPRMYGIIQ